MKTSTSKMMAVIAIAATAWAASSASAFGGGIKVKFGGGHGRGHGSFGHHGHHHGHHHHGHHHHKHHHHAHVRNVYVKPVYVAPVAPCIHPLHSFCFVYPGDTWSLLSLREYGRPNFGATIAAFNGMSTSMRLVVGQQLRMPVIHPNGSLTPSSAGARAVCGSQPADRRCAVSGARIFAANARPADSAAGSTGRQRAVQPPSSTERPDGPTDAARHADECGQCADRPPRPFQRSDEQPDEHARCTSVGTGVAVCEYPRCFCRASAGDRGNRQRALARRPGAGKRKGHRATSDSTAWPCRWKCSSGATDSVKIRLPELDIEDAMKAELEVLRADGSLASKTAIELTSAATRLALGN